MIAFGDRLFLIAVSYLSEKKKVKEKVKGVKNFDPEKQQWNKNKTALRPRMK